MGDHSLEHVLVIPRSLFDQLGPFHGFQAEPDPYLAAILDPANNSFLCRADAENDPTHKQIIPYALFQHGDRFLHYVRGGNAGEKRLASKGSIGIGGHVNQEDFHASGSLGWDLYLTGVEREIAEELRIGSPYRQSIIGLINDDTTEVGRVHLGVVHLFTLESPDVAANEEAITELSFRTREELLIRARDGFLESWSRLIVESMDQILAPISPEERKLPQ
jgi:predicted NUDIX family phosphoesterase